MLDSQTILVRQENSNVVDTRAERGSLTIQVRQENSKVVDIQAERGALSILVQAKGGAQTIQAQSEGGAQTIQAQYEEVAQTIIAQSQESAKTIQAHAEESTRGSISAMTYIQYFLAGARWPMLAFTVAIFIFGEVRHLNESSPLSCPLPSPSLCHPPSCLQLAIVLSNWWLSDW